MSSLLFLDVDLDDVPEEPPKQIDLLPLEANLEDDVEEDDMVAALFETLTKPEPQLHQVEVFKRYSCAANLWM